MVTPPQDDDRPKAATSAAQYLALLSTAAFREFITPAPSLLSSLLFSLFS